MENQRPMTDKEELERLLKEEKRLMKEDLRDTEVQLGLQNIQTAIQFLKIGALTIFITVGITQFGWIVNNWSVVDRIVARIDTYLDNKETANLQLKEIYDGYKENLRYQEED